MDIIVFQEETYLEVNAIEANFDDVIFFEINSIPHSLS